MSLVAITTRESGDFAVIISPGLTDQERCSIGGDDNFIMPSETPHCQVEDRAARIAQDLGWLRREEVLLDTRI